MKRKTRIPRVLSLSVFIAVAGMLLMSSCGSMTSVTPGEAYDAGYTIGRIISGN